MRGYVTGWIGVFLDPASPDLPTVQALSVPPREVGPERWADVETPDGWSVRYIARFDDPGTVLARTHAHLSDRLVPGDSPMFRAELPELVGAMRLASGFPPSAEPYADQIVEHGESATDAEAEASADTSQTSVDQGGERDILAYRRRFQQEKQRLRQAAEAENRAIRQDRSSWITLETKRRRKDRLGRLAVVSGIACIVTLAFGAAVGWLMGGLILVLILVAAAVQFAGGEEKERADVAAAAEHKFKERPIREMDLIEAAEGFMIENGLR